MDILTITTHAHADSGRLSVEEALASSELVAISHQLEINGEVLHQQLFDPFTLLDLIYPQNKYRRHGFELYTCSCGEPGCAGIATSYVLKKRGDRVTFRTPKQASVYFPIESDGMMHTEMDWDRHEVERQDLIFTVSVAQLVEEIRKLQALYREIQTKMGSRIRSFDYGIQAYEEDEACPDMAERLEEALVKALARSKKARHQFKPQVPWCTKYC